MIDNSVPYYTVILTKTDTENYPHHALPEGYEFVFYKTGDEIKWAELELSLGQFNSIEQGLDFFKRDFIDDNSQNPEERVIFVKDPDGDYIATGSLWSGFFNGEICQKLHWIAVSDKCAGKGIAKALTSRLMDLYNDLGCEGFIFLVTGSCYYPAINIYRKFGFSEYVSDRCPTGDMSDEQFARDTAAAVEIINEKLQKKTQNLPNYYLDELERVKKALIEDQRDALFSALVIADSHIDYELMLNKENGGHFWHKGNTGEIYRECELIYRQLDMTVHLANTTDVDCVIFAGDILHGCGTHESSIDFLSKVADRLSGCRVPVYVNRGNHDLNDYHGRNCPMEYIVTQNEWNNILLDSLARGKAVHDENDSCSTYYYVDFEDKKLRLITLDSYNYPLVSSNGVTCDYKAETWNKIDDAQLIWLVEKALDTDKKGWTYVISSHAPICGPESFLNNKEVQTIISAFNNREKITVCGKEIDYTAADGKIPLSLSGHTHVASYRLFDEASHVCVNTSAARLAYYPTRPVSKTENFVSEMPIRYEGTIAEAMLDIVTLKKDGKVIRRNFGPVSDAEFIPTDNGYRRI